jgi:hypothetical protein
MNYQVIKTPDEVRRAVEAIYSQPVVGLDTETTDLDPFTSRLRLIQLATPDRVFIFDFDAFANGDATAAAKGEALAPLRRLLEADQDRAQRKIRREIHQAQPWRGSRRTV